MNYIVIYKEKVQKSKCMLPLTRERTHNVLAIIHSNNVSQFIYRSYLRKQSQCGEARKSGRITRLSIHK